MAREEKVMNCRDFSLIYSAQLDGYADERSQPELQAHLRSCATCRHRAAEMRSLMSDLRSLNHPSRSSQMTSRIQAAVRREARNKAGFARRRADWIDLWRTRLFSQSVGAIISMALFLSVAMGVHWPAYRALALAQAATEVMLDDNIRSEIRLKVLLLQPPPPPVFNPGGELLGFGASLSEDDEMMATVKVNKDGRATVNEIVISPRDPAMTTRFSSAINQQASFQPPRRDRNISADAVVIFSKVNISG